jgi:hypothetical protein
MVHCAYYNQANLSKKDCTEVSKNVELQLTSHLANSTPFSKVEAHHVLGWAASLRDFLEAQRPMRQLINHPRATVSSGLHEALQMTGCRWHAV